MKTAPAPRHVTAADRHAVYALLTRMLDWLPPARLSVTRPEPGPNVARPGVGTWARCEGCAGTGRVTAGKPCRKPHVHVLDRGTPRERTVPARWPYGHGCVPCPSCENGWVHARPGAAGDDRMLGPVKHGLLTDAHEKAERRRWVDAQLARLRDLERQWAGVEAPPDSLTRAVDAKARLYGQGSFRQLEAALDLLATVAPLRFEAVRVYVIEGQFEPPPDVRARLDETVGWLAARMPAEIRLPADAAAEVEVWKRSLEHGRTAAHRAQRDARNREIVELVDGHGWSLRRAGSVYGLSAEGVRKIVASARESAAVGAAA